MMREIKFFVFLSLVVLKMSTCRGRSGDELKLGSWMNCSHQRDCLMYSSESFPLWPLVRNLSTPRLPFTNMLKRAFQIIGHSIEHSRRSLWMIENSLSSFISEAIVGECIGILRFRDALFIETLFVVPNSMLAVEHNLSFRHICRIVQISFRHFKWIVCEANLFHQLYDSHNCWSTDVCIHMNSRRSHEVCVLIARLIVSM